MWAIQAQASDRRSRKKSHLGSRSIISMILLYSRRRFFALLHRLGPHPGGDARIARVTREI
ncbi:hypothetical protein JCM18909_2472 [Cutibacterium acnes JCM 18909]|nr:hypothetical protein JCM18909_2472 [Cutibacterium acnes JCM 18909]